MGGDASWEELKPFWWTMLIGYLLECLQRLVGTYLERNNKEFKARNVAARKRVSKSNLLIYLYLIQCAGSIMTCFFAIRKMYTKEVPDWMIQVENCFAAFFTFFHLFKAFLQSFKMAKLVAVTNLLDMVTIASLLAQNFNDGYWLSFSYLQAAQAYVSFARVERHFGVLARLLRSQVGAALANSLAATFAFIICMAGSMSILESLPDPSGWNDEIDTEEHFTFLNWSYMAVVTITTVGYGDITPKTALGQLGIMIFIVAGIIFFSMQADRLIEIFKTRSKGALKYYPPRDSVHYIVCGGAVRADSALIGHFVHEVFNEDHLGTDAIQLVFMSRSPLFELDDLSSLTTSLQFRDVLNYINGSPMIRDDMLGAGAHVASGLFVLADPGCADKRREDLRNILRTLEAQRRFQSLSIHLLLLTSKSMAMFEMMGVDVTSVVVVENLKANLLAAAVHCPGLSTMVSNLVGSVGVEVDSNDMSPWMSEYLGGAELEIYRVEVSDNVRHLQFAEAAYHIFAGCGVTLMGAERLGQLYLNPYKSPLRVFEFLYVIADDEGHARSLSGVDFEVSCSKASSFEKAGPATVRDASPQQTSKHLQLREVTMMNLDSDEEPSGLRIQEPRRTAAAAAAAAAGASATATATATARSKSRRGMAAQQRATGGAVPALRQAVSWKVDDDGRSYAEILRTEPWRSEEEVCLSTTEAELQYIKTLAGHIFVVCGSSSLVVPLLKTLREDLHMDDENHIFTPIVVCLATVPNVGVVGELARYDGVHLVIGDVSHVNGLIAYGINHAKTVLLVEVKDATSDKLMGDLHSVFTVSSIFANSPEPVFTLTELEHDENVRFFSTIDVVANMQRHSGQQQVFKHHRSEIQLDLGDQLGHDNVDTSVLRMHPLYIAGRVFSMSFLGNLLAQAVFTPTLPALVDLLLKPASEMPESSSFVTQIRVPAECVGRSYTDMFRFLYKAEHCVPLGLYRAKGTNGALLPYLVTSPDRETEIMPSDNVIVLMPVASTRGAKAGQEGSLASRRVKNFA